MKRVLNGLLCIVAGFLVWLGSYSLLSILSKDTSSINLYIALIPGIVTIYGLARTLESNKRLKHK